MSSKNRADLFICSAVLRTFWLFSFFILLRLSLSLPLSPFLSDIWELVTEVLRQTYVGGPLAGVEIIWESKERGYKYILDTLVGAKDGAGEREYCGDFKHSRFPS